MKDLMLYVVFIKACESIITRNDSLQSFNHQILIQNEKVLSDNNLRMKQYEIQFDKRLEGLSKTQTCIQDLYDSIKANQQQIVQNQESIKHLIEVTKANQTVILESFHKSEK
jgi:hypothetical protein